MSILQPHDRVTLVDALRPPSGFAFDAAVATTYSLHLDALLTAPLAFALYDAIAEKEQQQNPDGDGAEQGASPSLGAVEPVSVLEAVRRHARRMVVFCQAGQIAVPSSRPVLAWLEEVVASVVAPHPDGVFHPKVWVVRYRRAGDDASVLRFLCASRNITFDRSWDTLLRLDSEVLGDDGDQKIDPGPLADFVDALPAMAPALLTIERRRVVEELADDVRRCRFSLPDGCPTGRFWPLGVEDHNDDPLPPARTRSLSISPFVTAGRLSSVAAAGTNHALVARGEELDRLPPGALDGIEEVYVLSADTDLAVADDDEASDDETNGDEATDQKLERTLDDPSCALTGLHAKVTVCDTPHGAVVLSGSANATTAAFERNVEFVTELLMPATAVDALLQHRDGESASFAKLLEPYQQPEQPIERTAEEQLADEVDPISRTLAATPFRATVNEGDTTPFVLTLSTDQAPLTDAPDEIELRARTWPVTMSDSYAQKLDLWRPSAVQVPCSLEAISSFFAIELTGSRLGFTATKRFVVNAPMSGAPDNRHTRIIAAMLRDPGRFIRYLLLLLGDPGNDHAMAETTMAWFGDAGSAADGTHEIPVFEVLVRALARHPERLDHVASLVDELRDTEDGRAVLPDGFAELWDVLWTAKGDIDG